MEIILMFIVCTAATVTLIIKINQYNSDKFKNNK